jgi:hypothetical protein
MVSKVVNKVIFFEQQYRPRLHHGGLGQAPRQRASDHRSILPGLAPCGTG